MGKLKNRKGNHKNHSHQSHTHHGHSHHSHQRHDEDDLDYEKKEQQRARDELLNHEISCFIFIINKDEENTATRLPKWLIETRYKKNWILFHSSTINKKLLWNDVHDDNRPILNKVRKI